MTESKKRVRHPAVDYRKETSPQQTVSRIQDILADVGIRLEELEYFEGVGDAFSLTVTPEASAKGQIMMVTMGKGISTDLARASAYAEFAERLQNSTRQTPVLVKSRFGLMPKAICDPPDAYVSSLGDLVEQGEPAVLDLLKHYDLESPAAKTQEMVCFPFFNFMTGKVVGVPAKLLFRFCLSTGMAAGNTAEEAILQGLCEIFERYAASQIYHKRLRVPNIPMSELSHLKAFELIKKLQSLGYRVIVKDCSLGGQIPVVAAVLFQPKSNRYKLRFASDPNLDVAIQRCLTEMFEGGSLQDFEKKRMLPLLWNQDSEVDGEQPNAISRFWRDGNAQFVKSLFVADSNPWHGEAFFIDLCNNKQYLVELTERLQRTGYQLLVRDVSYLGFPSYYIYVPNMSIRAENTTKISLADHGLSEKEEQLEPYRFLARLDQRSVADIKNWLEWAEKNLKGNQIVDGHVASWFGNIMVDEEAGLTRLYYRDLLFCELSCRIGDYKQAFVWLNRHIDTVTRDATLEIENNEYTWCALACLRLKSLRLSENEIIASLGPLFGEEIAEEVLSDISSPNKPIQNCILPRCGNCIDCPLEEHCVYEPWSELVDKLNQRMTEVRIDQAELAKVFNPSL